eukprot:39404-Amorphochlora_amoeboformis.AAC.1
MLISTSDDGAFSSPLVPGLELNGRKERNRDFFSPGGEIVERRAWSGWCPSTRMTLPDTCGTTLDGTSVGHVEHEDSFSTASEAVPQRPAAFSLDPTLIVALYYVENTSLRLWGGHSWDSGVLGSLRGWEEVTQATGLEAYRGSGTSRLECDAGKPKGGREWSGFPGSKNIRLFRVGLGMLGRFQRITSRASVPNALMPVPRNTQQ